MLVALGAATLAGGPTRLGEHAQNLIVGLRLAARNRAVAEQMSAQSRSVRMQARAATTPFFTLQYLPVRLRSHSPTQSARLSRCAALLRDGIGTPGWGISRRQLRDSTRQPATYMLPFLVIMNEPSYDPNPTSQSREPVPNPEVRAAAHSSLEAEAGESESEVRRTAEESIENAKDAAKVVGERVSKGAEMAKEAGRDLLQAQKDRVATQVRHYSDAARQVADKLEEEDTTHLSDFLTSAAERLDQLGRRIQDRSLGELVDDVEDIARRRPEVFFGGMFVVGLAAARFLKASRRIRRSDAWTSRRYSTEVNRPGNDSPPLSPPSQIPPFAGSPAKAFPSPSGPYVSGGTGASTGGNI